MDVHSRTVYAIALLAALVVLVFAGAGVAATTLIVTTTADGSDGACTASLCTLRDAVEAANSAGGGTVSIPAGHYVLTDGPLFVTAAVELDGAGARETILDGGGAAQVLRGSRDTAPSISVKGLTVTGGRSQQADAPDYNEGGGIISWGPLTLDHAAVVSNTATADGGGLAVESALTIVDSTIAHNAAAGDDGGIRAQNGSVSIADSTIADNTASGRAGAGDIDEFFGGSTESITDSTIAGNAQLSGTFAFALVGGALTLRGTVIANDLTGGTVNCGLLSGASIDSGGDNLASDGSCNLTGGGDQAPVTDVGLGPLADNGGGTDTMLPQPGSPLIDSGGGSCSAADERGDPRPAGAACDIGAVEVAATSTAPADIGELGCIAETNPEGCATTNGAGLKGADWIATSPDGKSVYVASFDTGVAEFARAADGSLSELGCISAVSDPDCTTSDPGLAEATSVVVSPDGKNVYATGSRDMTVMVFDRNADGTLKPAGCVQDATATVSRGCTTVHGMINPYDVVVSADGKFAYVAAGGTGGERGAVVELARASDGGLTQLPAPNDCIEESGSTDGVCAVTNGTGLLAATALALSPDGTSLYAVADTHAVRSGDAPGAIAAFTRDATTGALDESGCVGERTAVAGVTECQAQTAAGLSDLVNVAVSPDGKDVYTASDDSTGPLVELARAADGSLTPLGCIDSGGGPCGATAAGLASSFGIAVSPDGRDVYVAAAGSSPGSAPALVELARGADGKLSASTAVQPGNGLADALGVAVTADGANVYSAADSSFIAGTNGKGGAVAAFARTAATPPNRPPTAAFNSTVSGLSASLDASGSTDSDGTISSYAWEFGDGASGTGVTASHVYAAAGSYTIKLTVTDDRGATAVATRNVTVSAPHANQPPAAAFTSTSSGLSLTVDATGSSDGDGTIASYSWDFGDGATGGGRTATHVYAAGGTYHVTLTVVDNDGAQASASRDVALARPVPASTSTARSTSAPAFVDAPPVASFVITPPSGNKRTSFLVDASGSTDADDGIATYGWDFGDGTFAAGVRARHSYAHDGVYTVVLTVVDHHGNSSSASARVAITDAAPAPSFVYSVERLTATRRSTGSRTVLFASTSTDPDGRVVSETWRFGDGKKAHGARVTHTYGGTGTTFWVTLTVKDEDGVTETAGHRIKLFAPPPVVIDDETIVASEVPTLVPPLVLPIVEPIGVADSSPQLEPPLVLPVEEGIAVVDSSPQLVPPHVISVVEQIGMGDAGTPGAQPPSTTKPKKKGKKP